MKPSPKDPGPGAELGMAKLTGLLMANCEGMCTHMHAYACTHAHTNTHACVHACVHAPTHISHTHAHLSAHICTRIHTPMHACTHTPACIHTRPCPMYTSTCMCTHLKMHAHPDTCMHMHACTRTHMHHTPTHQGLAAFLRILGRCEATQVQQKQEDYFGLQPRGQCLIELRGRGWGCPSSSFPGREPEHKAMHGGHLSA